MSEYYVMQCLTESRYESVIKLLWLLSAGHDNVETSLFSKQLELKTVTIGQKQGEALRLELLRMATPSQPRIKSEVELRR